MSVVVTKIIETRQFDPKRPLGQHAASIIAAIKSQKLELLDVAVEDCRGSKVPARGEGEMNGRTPSIRVYCGKEDLDRGFIIVRKNFQIAGGERERAQLLKIFRAAGLVPETLAKDPRYLAGECVTEVLRRLAEQAREFRRDFRSLF